MLRPEEMTDERIKAEMDRLIRDPAVARAVRYLDLRAERRQREDELTFAGAEDEALRADHS